MIKLLNRKPRPRRKATAEIVLRWDPTSGTFITKQLPLSEAVAFWEAMKLQKLDLGTSYRGTYYGPRRSWRNMLHHEWPPHHPDVLAAIAAHETQTQNTEQKS